MNNPFSLEGKHILVTGASSGIGKTTVEVLSEQGATVILVGRDEQRLNDTLESLSNKDDHWVEPFDLSEIDGIPAWLKQVVARTGKPLNGVVHCAGHHNTVPLRVISEKSINDVMSINLYAGLGLLRGCTNKNIFVPQSSFVFISSVMGLVGQAGVVGYSASKGAIIAAVKAAALEFSNIGTRVNCICPGMVETSMADELFATVSFDHKSNIEKQHPLGMGKPEDVAYAASYLVSDASRWVTGTSLIVDGGYTCH
ncbi:MAG: SDR family NAD(P)-dependent oxidoreductase [Candidatus Pristimantibacillus sp.]